MYNFSAYGCSGGQGILEVCSLASTGDALGSAGNETLIGAEAVVIGSDAGPGVSACEAWEGAI